MNLNNLKRRFLIWFFVKGNPFGITKVEYNGELTIYFNHSEEPFGIVEFTSGSPTRLALEELQTQLEHI